MNLNKLVPTQLVFNGLWLFCLLVLSTNSWAQHGIGTTEPNPNAALQIASSDKGVLLPQISLTASTTFFTGVTPSAEDNGMLVYNTNTATNTGLVGEGYYFWSGSQWEKFIGDTDLFTDLDSDTQIQVEETADDDSIRFDTAGTERMLIDNTGNVGIGINNPTQTLTVSGTVQITGALHDSSGVAGTAGQHLSSTGTSTLWVDSAGTSIADGSLTGNTLFWDGIQWKENQEIFVKEDVVTYLPVIPNPIHSSVSSGISSNGSFIVGTYFSVIDDDELYVINSARGPQIFDVSDPANPIFLGETGIQTGVGYSFYGADKQGDFLYVVSDVNNNGGIVIYDVSDPSDPDEIKYIPYTTLGVSPQRAIEVEGNYVYFTSNIGGTNGVTVLNIADPMAPFVESSIPDASLFGVQTTGNWSDIRQQGNYLYVLSAERSSLTILDLTNPALPVVVGSIMHGGAVTMDNPRKMDIRGSYAYVASMNSNSLTIISIIDPTNPVQVGLITDGQGGAELSGANSVQVEDKYAIVGAQTGKALEVIDIADATAPFHIATLADGSGGADFDQIRDLKVSNGYVYTSNTNSLQITDLQVTTAIGTSLGIRTVSPDQALSVNGDASKQGGGSWITFSDKRVKDNIVDYENGLSKVLQVRPVSFNYNEKSGYSDLKKEYVGVLAQEIEKVFPNTVTYFNDSNGPSGLIDKRQFNSSEILYAIINSIKELDQKNTDLKKENQSLKRKLEQILKRLENLEK